MAKSLKQPFKTPVGELRWVNISKDGIDNSMAKDGSKMQKVATIILSGDAKNKAITTLNEIWEYFKDDQSLKKGVQPKSVGWKALKDEDGNETGEIAIQFKTNAKLPDGRECIVKVLNAAGKEVDLQDKAIGNGSMGVIHGDAAFYDANGTKGITLYLKAIQLTKFVEYKLNVDAEDLSGEGEFAGFDDDGIPF